MLIRVNNFVEDDVNQSNSVEMMASWQLWLASHNAFVTLDSGSNSLKLAVGSFFAMQEPFRWYRIVGDLVTVSQSAIDVGGNFKNNTQYYLYLVDDGDNGKFVLSGNANQPSGTTPNNSLWVAQFKTKTGGIIDASTIIDSQMRKLPSIEELFPVGYVYTQYPSMPDPSTLYPRATWTNISSSFAGDFFRVEGGLATTFNGGKQASSLTKPSITVSKPSATTTLGRNYLSYLLSTPGDVVDNGFKRDHGAKIEMIAPESLISAITTVTQPTATVATSGAYGLRNEVAPANQTIRLWRKTGVIAGYSSFALIDDYSIFVDTVELGEDEAGIIGYNPAIHVALPQAMPKALSRDEHNDKVLYYDKDTQEWKRVPDDRGKIIYHRDGSQRKCDAVIAVLTDEESFEPFVMPDVDDITDPA